MITIRIGGYTAQVSVNAWQELESEEKQASYSYRFSPQKAFTMLQQEEHGERI